MYMLYVKYPDGTTENIYGGDESKLWDLIDEVRAENEIAEFGIEECR